MINKFQKLTRVMKHKVNNLPSKTHPQLPKRYTVVMALAPGDQVIIQKDKYVLLCR